MLLLFDLWGESLEKVKWRHTLYCYSCKVWLSFKGWFRRYKWKELSVSYLHTYIYTYIHTNQPTHRISISWLKSSWPRSNPRLWLSLSPCIWVLCLGIPGSLTWLRFKIIDKVYIDGPCGSKTISGVLLARFERVSHVTHFHKEDQYEPCVWSYICSTIGPGNLLIIKQFSANNLSYRLKSISHGLYVYTLSMLKILLPAALFDQPAIAALRTFTIY